ncbi:MAG TPA: L-lactate permease [Actinomycetes bacterium]|nr:L-lactate permease [Actinomycetes bacterium]
MNAFTQTLNPVGGTAGSTLLALAPVAVLLVLLAVFRLTAWVSVVIGSAITWLLAVFVWNMPVAKGGLAYLYGSATGVWAVDWIVFWGLIIFNTLVVTGGFDRFKAWLVSQATADIRIQTLLLAWAFGALLEGLVGFGYPWAVVAPILIALGVRELDAIRVAAIANNAPVSFGALGAPIIALSAVTGLALNDLAASVGRIVAILALLPPWILIYLVSGKRGLRTGWPLAVVGSLGYIVGQFPISQTIGPYLPDIIGSLTAFAAILALVKLWRPREILGFGGEVVQTMDGGARRPLIAGGAQDTPQADRQDERSEAAKLREEGRRISGRDTFLAVLPFIILVAVVVAWTGPWSPLPDIKPASFAVQATSSLTHKPVSAKFEWPPFIAGTSILASWLLIILLLRPRAEQLREVFRRSFAQSWGALLVGVFIFGLAFTFNFSGMAATMANGFSKIGTPFILLAPVLGWIAVALSGSNTSSNAVFGQFQVAVARLLHLPILLTPSLNSVGAEVGKPVAPQTASVGVSTTRHVRDEGRVIRHNMGWTFVILAYLVGIGVLFYFLLPGAMRL